MVELPGLERIPALAWIISLILAVSVWFLLFGHGTEYRQVALADARKLAANGEIRQLVVRVPAKRLVAYLRDDEVIEIVPYSADVNRLRSFGTTHEGKAIPVGQDLTDDDTSVRRWIWLFLLLGWVITTLSWIDIWLHWRAGLLTSKSARNWGLGILIAPGGPLYWLVFRRSMRPYRSR